jgi:hypothetical protein
LTPTERRAAFADVSDLAQQGRLELSVALSWLPAMLAAGDWLSIWDGCGSFPPGSSATVPIT